MKQSVKIWDKVDTTNHQPLVKHIKPKRKHNDTNDYVDENIAIVVDKDGNIISEQSNDSTPAKEPTPAPSASTETPAVTVTDASPTITKTPIASPPTESSNLKYILGGVLLLGGIGAAATGGGGGGDGKTTPNTDTNHTPIPTSDTATVNEDSTANTIKVLANDTDADGDTLTVTKASATHGTVTINTDGTLNYTPAANYNGTDTIYYSVSDGKGGTASSTVTVTVSNTSEIGYLIDSPVAGVDYYIKGDLKGQTDFNGSFKFELGDKVTFKIGNITLAENITPNTDHIVYLQDLAGVSRDNPTDGKVVKLAQLIQSLDTDNNPSNGITIQPSRIKDGLGATTLTADTDIATLLDAGVAVVTPQDALDHVNDNADFLMGRDNIRPTVKSIEISGDKSLKAGETAIVTVTFSEGIVPQAGIIKADNGTLSLIANESTDTVKKYTFTPNVDITDTTNSIVVTEAYTDLLGNKGHMFVSGNYTIDTKRPTATITITDTNGDKVLTLGETATITIKFSEKVNWGEIPIETFMTATNGVLSDFTGVADGGMTYTGTFTPYVGVVANASGANVITLDMSKMVDDAGNAGAVVKSDEFTVNTPLKTAEEIFANMGDKYEFSDTAGQYRTMFEMAVASYVHLDSMSLIPGMGETTLKNNDANTLKLDSRDNLLAQGISFGINAEELGLKDILFFDPDNTPKTDTFFHNGYYISYNLNYGNTPTTSSVALIGRTQKELFISFRGTDIFGDKLDDALAGGLSMSEHYDRYLPLFAGIQKYLSTHPEIKQVYVGGHSLGGEMATIFMQNHKDGYSLDGHTPANLQYDSITFEAANKNLGDDLQASYAVDRSINFEMWSDWVADLGYTNGNNSNYYNYGNTLHLSYERDYGYERFLTIDYFPIAHYNTSLNKEINKVFLELPKPDLLKGETRYYVDQSENGNNVLVTKNIEDIRVLEGDLSNIEESAELENTDLINSNQHDFNIIWNDPNAQHTLIIKPIIEGWYEVPVKGIDNIILSNEADKKFNVNAHQAGQDTFIIGNDADNVLQGGVHNDILFGSGGIDVLIGGAGNDQLYGADYVDLHSLFDSHFNTGDALAAVNKHAASDMNDKQTYLIGGVGADNIACTSDNSDFIFVDVNASTKNAGNVDTINYFEDTILNTTSDYLIFSAEQLGITQDIANSGLSAYWSILGKMAWKYHEIESFIASKFFISASGDVTFSLDGNQANAYQVAKIAPTNGNVDIEAHNIRIVDSFTGLQYDNYTLDTNTAPTIDPTSVIAGAVTEDSTTQSISGQIIASDIDGDTRTYTTTQATYGTMTIDASGKWTYALNNANAAVQALKTNEKLTDSAVVTVDDGHGGKATQTVTVTINGADEPLATNTYTYNGHTYMLTTGAMTWTNAEAQAVAMGGHLVTVNDQAEQDWILQKFGHDKGYWIGLNDVTTEGTWQWSSGETSTYRHWYANEPNSNLGKNEEDYVCILPQTLPYEGAGMYGNNPTGAWNDWPNTGGNYKTPLTGIIEIPSAPTTYTYNGHTYMLTTNAMTWTNAEAQAVAMGGHLVTINNQAEQDWIVNTFGVNDNLWLGLNDVAQEGNYVWSSGETTTYKNWQIGEPNNGGVGTPYSIGEEDWVATWKGTGGWNDFTQNGSAKGIIEIPSAPSHAGDAMIDLGAYGKLIAPVHIDNNGDGVADSWFYVWDMNGDGSMNSSDECTHDVLDEIFNHDSVGKINSTDANYDGQFGTTNEYRYAELNGVKLALPTIGTSTVLTTLAQYLNPDQNYSDLAEIWDEGIHKNGYSWVGTSTDYLWSATESGSSHGVMRYISSGDIFHPYSDLGSLGSVILQVL